jgi:regulatory protein
MEIKWQTSPEDPRFLLISVDGDPWKSVYKSIFARHLNPIRRVTSPEDLQEKFHQIEAQLAKAHALKLLGLKGRLTQELKDKLGEKAFSDHAINFAITTCQKLGFLNDQEELRALVRREQRKGYGPNLIALKLRAKDPAANLTQLLKEARETQTETIQSVIRKKCKNVSDRRKVMQMLQRRGFDWDAILSSLR